MDFYVIHPSVSDARDDGAITRGWIPDWMPDHAINIHEAHNLDTNSRAVSFTVPKAEWLVSTLNCQDTVEAPQPQKVTNIFPEKIHQKERVKDCRDFFLWIEDFETVHIWAN